MNLQKGNDVTLLDSRVLFDKLLDEFEDDGSCKKHLAVGTKIVSPPDFENGIGKE
jgi:hypothetical protein